MNLLQIVLLVVSTLLALTTAVLTTRDRHREQELAFRRDLESRLQNIATAIVEVGSATELHYRRVARMRLKAALASLNMHLPASQKLLDAPIEEVPKYVDEALDHVSILVHTQARIHEHTAFGFMTRSHRIRSWFTAKLERE